MNQKKELKAIGIGVASRKTFVYKKAGGAREGRYLVLGDFVAVLAREGNYSYVRYVNPDMMIDDADPKKVTLGWVRSSDISNPFPSSLKKRIAAMRSCAPLAGIGRSMRNSELLGNWHWDDDCGRTICDPLF
ncbi:hypothetical protein [Burkholderia ambifaria]|uniref:hypothetical protein n=1 Tax=Burkholderia ambifaria TaxID=152480 RepID=UPI0012FE2CE1|nr:hypothetical protein [Burkholderia ambifaria]